MLGLVLRLDGLELQAGLYRAELGFIVLFRQIQITFVATGGQDEGGAQQ